MSIVDPASVEKIESLANHAYFGGLEKQMEKLEYILPIPVSLGTAFSFNVFRFGTLSLLSHLM
jgi:hypothetical protein